ncbi:MAG TPA: hypothetical protein VKM55_08455 [Candidatus Lokiarchaeia archaeon]|nr:hypothetical protein [Candidatus Lokiarchaeia archaeon]
MNQINMLPASSENATENNGVMESTHLDMHCVDGLAFTIMA